MRGISIGLTLVAVVAPLMTAAPALAQREDSDLAKRYYKLGEELYNRADYEEALRQFEKAHQHSGRPALLYNMARCHEGLGNHGRAVELYERYLNEARPPNAPTIQARITNLRRLMDKHAPAPAAPPASAPASQPSPASQPARPAAPTGAAATRRPLDRVVLVPVSRPAPRGRPMLAAGWALVGVGGASVGVGVALGILASNRASDLEDKNASGTVEYDNVTRDEEAGRRLQVGQIVALVAGGAIVATGGVLLFLDAKRQRAERRAWVSPVVTAGGAMVSGGLDF